VAFGNIGNAGTAVGSTSASSFTLTTTSNSFNAASGRFGILRVAIDNISTTDGPSNDVVSVTGGNGTWTKLGEYTNANAGGGNGVTVALWVFNPDANNAVGTVFTINLSGNTVDKSARFWIHSCTVGQSVRDAASPVYNSVDASNDFGSCAISGLTSKEYLFVSALGKEANTTTTITPSSGFVAVATLRSRNNASAVVSAGEYDILTATGATSNPTLAVSGDAVNVFVALEEYTPSSGISGSASGDLPLTGSAVGTASVSGSASGTFDITGSSTATALIVGLSSGSLPLSGNATGSVGSTITGSAAGTLPLAGSAAATVSIAGLAAGSLPLTGSAVASMIVRGLADGAFPLSGSASGNVQVAGTADGTLPLTGSSTTISTITGSAAGTLSLTGASSAIVVVYGQADGILPLTGEATGGGSTPVPIPAARIITPSAQQTVLTLEAIERFVIPTQQSTIVTPDAQSVIVTPPQRCCTIILAGYEEVNMSSEYFQWPDKLAPAVIFYGIDWVNRLGEATIVSHDFELVSGGVTLTPRSASGTETSVSIAGGAAGSIAVIIASVVASDGETHAIRVSIDIA